jgi:hypothetical protein
MQDAVCLGLPMDEGAKREVPVDLAKAIVGCAHHFRPTYDLANVGHPSDFLQLFGDVDRFEFMLCSRLAGSRCAPEAGARERPWRGRQQR